MNAAACNNVKKNMSQASRYNDFGLKITIKGSCCLIRAVVHQVHYLRALTGSGDKFQNGGFPGLG